MKQHILLTLAGLLWMPLAFAQPIVKVRGTQDSLAVKNQIMLYLDLLDVRGNIHLNVYFSADVPDKLSGMTYCMNSPLPDTYQVIRIWIDARLNKTQQRLVLAHEMVHVKQYAKGEIIVVSKREVLWKGKKYRHKEVENRRKPWECEAHFYDNQLAKRCKEQLETPLVATRPNH